MGYGSADGYPYGFGGFEPIKRLIITGWNPNYANLLEAALVRSAQ